MKAIIIAAGSGTRLGNQKDIPKSLLDINGQTILERQIDVFQNQGIYDIVVVTGPNNHKFTYKNIRYVKDENFAEHDILGSLMAARDFFNDEIVISYSDILYDAKVIREILHFDTNLGIVVDKHWQSHYEGRTDHPTSEAENVLLRNNRPIQIKKNIVKEQLDDKVVEFLGLFKMSKQGSSAFLQKFLKLENSHKGTFHDAPTFKKAYLTDMIQELIESKTSMDIIPVTGTWCEIDTQQDLENAKKIFK